MLENLYFFVIVTDSSRKENPGFYLSCVLLHMPGAPMYALSFSSSLAFTATVSVRYPRGSHFHLYHSFLVSFHLHWKAHRAWKLQAYSAVREQMVLPAQLLQGVDFQ